jgi:hypothetical protein
MNYSDCTLATLYGHLREAAASAIFVQEACNLSGVVHDFARVMALLSELSQRLSKGTEWKNHHPIAVLYASKISSLTGADVAKVFSKAYDRCQSISVATTYSTDTGWD